MTRREETYDVDNSVAYLEHERHGFIPPRLSIVTCSDAGFTRDGSARFKRGAVPGLSMAALAMSTVAATALSCSPNSTRSRASSSAI